MDKPTPYFINNRTLTAFQPLIKELEDTPHHNTLFDLSYLSVIDVNGAQNHAFLQGQLSCDVREVTADHMRQGALCNLKGRVLVLLDVLEWQGLHLIVPSDLSERTEHLLAKPAAFSRVTLQQAPHYAVFGFYLKNPTDLHPLNWTLPTARFDVVAHDEGCCYALGDGAYLLLIHTEHQEKLTEPFIRQQQYRGSLAWHAKRLQQGHLEIYPESSGLFLPHRLDLQKSGQLSFNKGCYKGQEVIARMHYRATLKHTVKQFIIQCTEPLRSGLKLLSPDQEIELGELIDFCPLHNQTYLITTSIFFEHPSQCRLENSPFIYTLQAP